MKYDFDNPRRYAGSDKGLLAIVFSCFSLFVILLLIKLAIIVAIIYVIIHFLAKIW